jgi:putative phosphoesterase
MVKDLVISDLHLGDPSCNRKNILKLLRINFEQLIINGDVISCYHSDRLTSLDFSILEILEHYQSQKRCILIEGNHELHVDLKKYTSLKFVKDFVWQRFGVNFGAIHGHKQNLTDLFSSVNDIATNFAKKNNCKVLFYGHNHVSCLTKRENVIYVNTGTFISFINNFAIVTDKKMVYLKDMMPKIQKNLLYNPLLKFYS